MIIKFRIPKDGKERMIKMAIRAGVWPLGG